MAMAAGREVLKVIDDEGLQENCRVLGERYMKGLNELKDRYEEVGDVRGAGLMIGVEFVTDKESKNPDGAFFADFHEATKTYGVLAGKGGRFGNVMRLQPPMCMTAADVDFSLDVFERSIKDARAAKAKRAAH